MACLKLLFLFIFTLIHTGLGTLLCTCQTTKMDIDKAILFICCYHNRLKRLNIEKTSLFVLWSLLKYVFSISAWLSCCVYIQSNGTIEVCPSQSEDESTICKSKIHKNAHYLLLYSQGGMNITLPFLQF